MLTSVSADQQQAQRQRCIANHPCFGRPNNAGRIHLPIASGCNISCNFCERSVNDRENRPGVTREILSEEEALALVDQAVQRHPELAVIGVAGPGDTLCTPATLSFFTKARLRWPGLIRCMSTNGLLLPERMDEVQEAGIQTLTVTVNSLLPATQAQICSWISYHGRRYTGQEGARILIDNQLKGISMAVQAGIVVKVNTVLCPGVNDTEIEAIAQTMGALGVFRYNIIPLIPCYKFAQLQAPGCQELARARGQASPYIEVFCHCQHCRADAIGIPGKTDYAGEFYPGREGALTASEPFSHG